MVKQNRQSIAQQKPRRPKRLPAYMRDEYLGQVRSIVDDVMDRAYRVGLSPRDIVIAVEETAVNWKAPRRR